MRRITFDPPRLYDGTTQLRDELRPWRFDHHCEGRDWHWRVLRLGWPVTGMVGIPWGRTYWQPFQEETLWYTVATSFVDGYVGTDTYGSQGHGTHDALTMARYVGHRRAGVRSVRVWAGKDADTNTEPAAIYRP